MGSRPTDTLSLLKDINAGILTNVSYRIRDEEGTQSQRAASMKSAAMSLHEPLASSSVCCGVVRALSPVTSTTHRHLSTTADRHMPGRKPIFREPVGSRLIPPAGVWEKHVLFR